MQSFFDKHHRVSQRPIQVLCQGELICVTIGLDMNMIPPVPAASDTPGEMLKRAMRHWATGVAVVTSEFGGIRHGMTVNSFTSVSVAPPLVTVTLANTTRTCALVLESGIYAVTILARDQQHLSELFAGRIQEEGDRLANLLTFKLETGAPLLSGGAAFLDCRVIYQYSMPTSTLFVGEVLAADTVEPARPPLLYYNRAFTGLK